MPSKEHLALVEKVAKAINGPFHPVPVGSPHTLEQLRDIRWQQINDVERRLCLASAQAAISTILAAQSAHIENEINGYIDYLKGLEKLPRSYVLRGMIELKRRLLAALRERE